MILRIAARILGEDGGKAKMIFGAICFLAGIAVFIFFKAIKHSRFAILSYGAEALGRIGFSLVYIIAGIIIGLWGFLQYLKQKNAG